MGRIGKQRPRQSLVTLGIYEIGDCDMTANQAIKKNRGSIFGFFALSLGIVFFIAVILLIGLENITYTDNKSHVSYAPSTAREDVNGARIESVLDFFGSFASPFGQLDCITDSGSRLNTTACNPDDRNSGEANGFIQSKVVEEWVRRVKEKDFEAVVEINLIYVDCLTREISPGSVTYPPLTCDIKEMDHARSSIVDFLAESAKSEEPAAIDAYFRLLWGEVNRAEMIAQELRKPSEERTMGFSEKYDLEGVLANQKASESKLAVFLEGLRVHTAITNAFPKVITVLPSS